MPAAPVPDRAGASEVTGDGRPAALVEARALGKRFGSSVAVAGVDFTVERGEVFGFLGPNGAGKTTIMRMIACVSPRTDGDLRVLGLDPRTDGAGIRSRIGVVPQDDNLDTELTVWDNLVIYGRYFGMPMAEIRRRATDLLDFARLTERRDDRVDPLSGGMKRRLTIARGLMNVPELLLLDEPTTGLDPQARHLLWERLYRLKRDGVTLVLTTHYMEEAEQLCDRLVIMDQGRIAAEGSPRSLIERYSTREVVELRYASPDAQQAALARLPALVGGGDGNGNGTERIEPLPDRLLVYTDHGDAAAARLARTDGNRGADGVAAAGIAAAGAGTAAADQPVSVLVRRSSLEDVFLRLTGRTLED
jgi:lipooligosaccharide transport system ATP-binding protein